jgi:hypothetical protein
MLPWSPAGGIGGPESSLVHACFLLLAAERITVPLYVGPARQPRRQARISP